MSEQARLFPEITLEDRIRLIENRLSYDDDKKRIRNIEDRAYKDGWATGFAIGCIAATLIAVWLATGREGN